MADVITSGGEVSRLSDMLLGLEANALLLPLSLAVADVTQLIGVLPEVEEVQPAGNDGAVTPSNDSKAAHANAP